MSGRFENCTQVSEACPVEATVLGYYPNLGSGYFFTIVFGLCLIGSIGLGIRGRTWSYTAAITCGLILETAGYVGRIILNDNPWDSGAFQLQICAIILGPTFICVSVYLTLKHVALAINPTLSRIPPAWYPRIFLPADLTCLIVQAIGGGIAAAAGHDKPDLQETGNRMIIAGIVLQVIVLGIFGGLGTDYLLRASRFMRTNEAEGTSGLDVWRTSKFRMFAYAISGAFLAIFIRCIYRIAEMAGGWGNHIMQDEPSFLVLDSTLVFVASFLLTVFHPAIFFPQMHENLQVARGEKREKKAEKKAEKDEKKQMKQQQKSGGTYSPTGTSTGGAAANGDETDETTIPHTSGSSPDTQSKEVV